MGEGKVPLVTERRVGTGSEVGDGLEDRKGSKSPHNITVNLKKRNNKCEI